MNILVVSPPTFGKHPGAAAKETFANVELLHNMGHEVSFYVIGSPSQHEPLIKEFSATHNVPVRIFMPNMKKWGHWLKLILFKNLGYLDRASYVFGQLIEDKDFNDHVTQFKPDVIIFFCAYSWPVATFARSRGIPCVLRSHNYEPMSFWECLNVGEMLLPSNWVRYWAKVRGEKLAVTLSSAVATLPFGNMRKYKKWKHKNIFVYTLAYCYNSIQSAWVHENKKPLDVFYLGASYLVTFHLRGAQVLIEDIAPEVHKRAPGEFVFHICGSKLAQNLRDKCNGTNIIYEDYVQDFEGFMKRMDIGAFPVFTGAVMKGKVFESMCRSFPIVIPQNCLGGYVLKDNDEVLMAETAGQFVEAILRLRDQGLRKHLSEGAIAFAKDNFSKDVLTKTITMIMDEAKKAEGLRAQAWQAGK
jgi:glycosyltransferase involved in cell wall biosynthesis